MDIAIEKKIPVENKLYWNHFRFTKHFHTEQAPNWKCVRKRTKTNRVLGLRSRSVRSLVTYIMYIVSSNLTNARLTGRIDVTRPKQSNIMHLHCMTRFCLICRVGGATFRSELDLLFNYPGFCNVRRMMSSFK